MSYQQPPPPGADTMPAAGQPKRRLPGTGMLITGIILVGVSIIGGIIAIILSVVSMVDDLSSFADSTHQVTEHVNVEGLGDQTWYIYQDRAVEQATCTVTDASGEDITSRASTMELSSREVAMHAVQSFAATANGSYAIECTRYPVALGPSVPFGSFIPMLLSGVGAGLLFVVGVVLTIIGAIRRSRAKRQRQQPRNPGTYPPAAGYGYPPQSPSPGSSPPRP